MQVNNAAASNAYKIAQQVLEKKSDESSGTSSASGGGFSNMLADAAKDTMNTVKNAEQVSAQAISGDASLIDVIGAVNSADMALKSVVGIRDRVISAYQDIIKMPM